MLTKRSMYTYLQRRYKDVKIERIKTNSRIHSGEFFFIPMYNNKNGKTQSEIFFFCNKTEKIAEWIYTKKDALKWCLLLFVCVCVCGFVYFILFYANLQHFFGPMVKIIFIADTIWFRFTKLMMGDIFSNSFVYHSAISLPATPLHRWHQFFSLVFIVVVVVLVNLHVIFLGEILNSYLWSQSMCVCIFLLLSIQSAFLLCS